MKTPFLIASLFLLLLWPALIEGKDKPEILLYLPFDEGEGLLTADKSGLGHKTEVVKAKWVQGKFGMALKFGGQGQYGWAEPPLQRRDRRSTNLSGNFKSKGIAKDYTGASV